MTDRDAAEHPAPPRAADPELRPGAPDSWGAVGLQGTTPPMLLVPDAGALFDTLD